MFGLRLLEILYHTGIGTLYWGAYGDIMGSYQAYVFAGLVLFGSWYTWFMGLAERRGWTEGYLSAFVAFGSAVTLGGLALIDLKAASLALLCFVLSGGPMMAGDFVRYMLRRERSQGEYRKGKG